MVKKYENMLIDFLEGLNIREHFEINLKDHNPFNWTTTELVQAALNTNSGIAIVIIIAFPWGKTYENAYFADLSYWLVVSNKWKLYLAINDKICHEN